jgi:hypothetical protein
VAKVQRHSAPFSSLSPETPELHEQARGGRGKFDPHYAQQIQGDRLLFIYYDALKARNLDSPSPLGDCRLSITMGRVFK